MRAPLPGQCKAGNRSASLCIDWSEGVRKKEKENEKEIDLKKKKLFYSFIEWPNVWWVEASLIEFSAAVLYKGHMGVEGYQTNSRLLFQSFLFSHGLVVYCVACMGFFMSRTARNKGKNQCSDGHLCVSVIHPLGWCDGMMCEYAPLHASSTRALSPQELHDTNNGNIETSCYRSTVTFENMEEVQYIHFPFIYMILLNYNKMYNIFM